LPTRYGPAAAWLGAAFFLEYLSLARLDWPAEWRATLWSWVSWSIAAGVWTARWRAEHGPAARDRFERLWFWFRDHWGGVWALRIQERFNRSAQAAGWPIRLSWFGLEGVNAPKTGVPAEVPIEAESAFRGLIRRFAQPWRLDEAAGTDASPSCKEADSAR
jgi:hypothetical protein